MHATSRYKLKSETEVTDVSPLMALELEYQVYHFFSNI